MEKALMQPRLVGMLFGMTAFLMTSAVQAQDIPGGMQIAKTWCSGCHQIDRQERKDGNDAVPSFPSVAQMNSTTAMSLSAFLSTPHGRMPDYALSRIEIENVSAYILSLRKP
jgi:mono/diheme cytochrome c family protein